MSIILSKIVTIATIILQKQITGVCSHGLKSKIGMETCHVLVGMMVFVGK